MNAGAVVIARAMALGADLTRMVGDELAAFRGKLGAEGVEQAACVALLRSLDVPVIVSPSGVKMRPVQVAEMKLLGFEAGVPDLLLPLHRVALEFKAPARKPKTSRSKSAFPVASAVQRQWLDRLAAGGWRCAVVFSAREARDLLVEWGVLTIDTPRHQPRGPNGWTGKCMVPR